MTDRPEDAATVIAAAFYDSFVMMDMPEAENLAKVALVALSEQGYSVKKLEAVYVLGGVVMSKSASIAPYNKVHYIEVFREVS